MATVDHIEKEQFQELYEGSAPPWDIGRPQKPFVDAGESITGSILDVGCGTGENALHFAERGHSVTGIDFLESPVAVARQKAFNRNLNVNFQVLDALMLDRLNERFDNIIDCGLFHGFSDEDRIAYVKSLTTVSKPGTRLFLLCFSDREPGTDGPRRVSQEELHQTFSKGWKVESITASRFETRPDLADFEFSKGGPYAWFCVVRKVASGCLEK